MILLLGLNVKTRCDVVRGSAEKVAVELSCKMVMRVLLVKCDSAGWTVLSLLNSHIQEA